MTVSFDQQIDSEQIYKVVPWERASVVAIFPERNRKEITTVPDKSWDILFPPL